MPEPQIDNPRDPPETAPSGVRLLPPGLPPAPPESGAPGPPELPLPDPSDRVLFALSATANALVVVRSILNVLESIPEEEELRRGLSPILAGARSDLEAHLQATRTAIVDGQDPLHGLYLQAFRDGLLLLFTPGLPRRLLDRLLRVEVFGPVARGRAEEGGAADLLYRWELRKGDRQTLPDSLPPRSFVTLALDDLLEEVRDETSYASRLVFEERVVQKLMGVKFGHLAATAPEFFRSGMEL